MRELESGKKTKRNSALSICFCCFLLCFFDSSNSFPQAKSEKESNSRKICEKIILSFPFFLYWPLTRQTTSCKNSKGKIDALRPYNAEPAGPELNHAFPFLSFCMILSVLLSGISVLLSDVPPLNWSKL